MARRPLLRPAYSTNMDAMRCRLPSLCFAMALIAGPAAAEPVRMAADAFGTQAGIEIRELPAEAAKAAALDALREIYEISQLTNPAGELPGSLGALNAAAGNEEPLLLDERASEVLRRGLQYCLWSNGAHGPLGGEIYRLWQEAAQGVPDPSELRAAVIGADCQQVSLAATDGDVYARIAAGTRAAAMGIERGFALDRAVEQLRSAGVENAWLEVGSVYRAIGDGPEGKGWLVALPPAPGQTTPSDQVWLRDQALAVATVKPVSSGPPVAFIDQRTGVPSRGVVMVAAVTELALDAEALAATLFVSGLREGQMRLGSLSPRPSVYWLLGQGKGEPLESTYRWSEVERVKRRRY